VQRGGNWAGRSPLYSNTVIGTLAVDRWAVTFGTARRAWAPSPLLAVPNVTAHRSTASVPITVLLYNGLLLSGFNVATLKLLVQVVKTLGTATSRIDRVRRDI